MVDSSGTTLYSYDSLDRMTRKTTPFGSLSYGHEAHGNLTNVVSSNSGGVAVGYRYDSLYRLANEVISADGSGGNTPQIAKQTAPYLDDGRERVR